MYNRSLCDGNIERVVVVVLECSPCCTAIPPLYYTVNSGSTNT